MEDTIDSMNKDTRAVIDSYLEMKIHAMQDAAPLEKVCKELIENNRPYAVLLPEIKRGFSKLVDKDTHIDSPLVIDQNDEAEIIRLCKRFVKICSKRRRLIYRMSIATAPGAGIEKIERESRRLAAALCGEETETDED